MSKVVNVIQGQFTVSTQPDVVLTTLLGSCIATCLCDPVAGIGGMNHFLLPGGTSDRGGSERYGVNAMELLINALLRQGADRSRLVAKVFGGGRMIETRKDIGQSNGEFALGFLETENIPCVNRSIGGEMGRKIRFWPSTGRVAQAFITSGLPDLVANPVPSRPPKLTKEQGDVDLF